MPKQEYFIRYATIVKVLNAPKSFEEIRRAVEDAYHDRGLQAVGYTQRTFQRDKNDILELFGIEICCGSESLYFIRSNGSIYEEVNLRMIEMFDLQHSLHSQKNIEEYVQLQHCGTEGSENIHTLISACADRRVVRFVYRYIWQEMEGVRAVYPYGLKEFDKRWYLVAWDPQKGGFRTYGLDRIRDLEVAEEKFSRREDFSLEEYFKDYYGIWSTKEPPVTVQLLSTSQYANYLKSSPLHPSQRIVWENEDESLFELTVYPSWDFIQKLMTMADQVRVLQPDSLRDDLVSALEDAAGYQINKSY